ncbi:MAG: hypothetical protein P8N56_01020 [Schleiferiaceae bacterium]|nr:hypothetical protein [Schleiferiaceae bacterium]
MKAVTHYFAHGKLLLTSEYTVLHGAWALAVPTQKGQYLYVDSTSGPLHWQALDCHGKTWLSGYVESDPSLEWLKNCIQAALALSGQSEMPQGRIRTVLEFERHWGWGSSSTVISLIAQWIGVPALDLHFRVSQGSGYDVACAQAKGAILYRRKDASAEVRSVSMKSWPIQHLYLAYLGQKQDSQVAVKHYLGAPDSIRAVAHTTRLSEKLLDASSPAEWSEILVAHEQFLEGHLQTSSPVFALADKFPLRAHAGAKSLGAWGGDFALICDPNPDALIYLHRSANLPVFPWTEVVLGA